MKKKHTAPIYCVLIFIASSTLFFAMTTTMKLSERRRSDGNGEGSDKSSLQSGSIETRPLWRKGTRTVEKLNLETDRLLSLFDEMPRVPVYVTDEPILKNGSATQKGVAYTACEAKNDPTIFIKTAFYERANQRQMTNILKHELTHAWFCRQGIRAAHDERFRQKFREVGGFGN